MGKKGRTRAGDIGSKGRRRRGDHADSDDRFDEIHGWSPLLSEAPNAPDRAHPARLRADVTHFYEGFVTSG